ncbi:ABC transporter ATP-binding protein [Candidatus Borrarchaeum sp.]|uniref:ABC transporter ATP-binding protein n=1 Tax=Candidatus Borrarchaeum sp. TaxID=2846742 RepID=UPI00257E5EFE|nr:ABC transporter ATP-binding protein [Candidatus Borrarchaeum sp.]
MTLAVEIKNLTKIYPGRGILNKAPAVTALDDVNLEIKKGTIYGLLGPNGAGKTTLIHILAGVLLPTTGTAEVFGHDVVREAREVRSLSNYGAGQGSLFWNLSPKENLLYYAKLYGLPNSEAVEKINNLLEFFGLKERANLKSAYLSSGLKQRVKLIKTLLNDPKLLLLDEPTLGLDVDIARKIRAYIQELSHEKEMTILLTSHNMYEVDELCDEIALIDKGRIVSIGTPDELKKKVSEFESLELSFSNYDGDPSSFLDDLVLRSTFRDGALVLHVSDIDSSIDAILRRLLSHKFVISSINTRRTTLEDVFLNLTGRGLK